jgi:hypothetical protein
MAEYVISRAAMRKINEVEGIHLTEQDEALLDELESVPESERSDRILAYVKSLKLGEQL